MVNLTCSVSGVSGVSGVSHSIIYQNIKIPLLSSPLPSLIRGQAAVGLEQNHPLSGCLDINLGRGQEELLLRASLQLGYHIIPQSRHTGTLADLRGRNIFWLYNARYNMV